MNYKPPTMNHEPSTINYFTVILALCLMLMCYAPAQAASTTNVWIGNALDADMESWAAEGLIESQLSSMKPVARSEAGRQIVAALDKCDALGNASATCKKLQQHYTKLFAAEIAETRNSNRTAGSFVKPIENFSMSYNYLDGPFSIFNNEGINYGQGSNAVVQFQSHARLWSIFSFYVQPALIYNNHDYRHFYEHETDVTLHRGYVKMNIANFEVQVGRDSLWWGPGYHGAMLISNNAHPFDMVKLSNPEPVLLPWLFSYLGPVQFNLIASELRDARSGTELANPFLYGLRLVAKPHPYLELGGSHLAVFGGSGRRDLSIGEIIKTLYSNSDRKGQRTESNQQAAVDVALTIPYAKKYIYVADGLKLYFEWGAEDNGFPPDRRAGLFGLALFKPFGLERAVFRSEYALISPGSVPEAWYYHPVYPMRYEGRVFGHHAGTDSDDIFVQWSHDIGDFFYKLSYDRERSGIKTQIYTQSKDQFAGEIGYHFPYNVKLTLQYAYEDIKDWGYVQDQRQKNHFLGTTVNFDF